MYCPFCNADETKVIDSRLIAEGLQVRRRRECLLCKDRFTTFETPKLSMPHVVKRDGRREAFSLENLKSGMLKALEKRPVSMEDLETAINDIKAFIRAKADSEITAHVIGEQVMQKLSILDRVAYVRFASVYKGFTDVNEFKDAIEQLNKKT